MQGEELGEDCSGCGPLGGEVADSVVQPRPGPLQGEETVGGVRMGGGEPGHMATAEKGGGELVCVAPLTADCQADSQQHTAQVYSNHTSSHAV